MSTETIKMALKALEEAQDCVRTNYHPGHYWEKEIEELRQALAEAEQKEKEKQHLVSILSKHIRIDPDTGNVGIGS